jgi:hypothetical protein
MNRRYETPEIGLLWIKDDLLTLSSDNDSPFDNAGDDEQNRGQCNPRHPRTLVFSMRSVYVNPAEKSKKAEKNNKIYTLQTPPSHL